MVEEANIIIISALIGGIITLIATHLTNKARRFELEYSYKIKQEETYMSNAQKHLNDVYIPLYRALTALKYNWLESGKLHNIDELKHLKKDLLDKGLSVFLTPDIDRNFDSLLEFISKSGEADKIRYGIIYRDIIMGKERLSYRLVPERVGLNVVRFYRRILSIWNLIKQITWIYSGLVDYEIKIILDSAPLDSKEFKEQFLDYLTDLEKKIKGIALGLTG